MKNFHCTRFNRSHFGMQVAENGVWVNYDRVSDHLAYLQARIRRLERDKQLLRMRLPTFPCRPIVARPGSGL